MQVYIYTRKYNPSGGSSRILEIYIRALKARGHTPVLTTFSSEGNDYAEQPCEMREENFKGKLLPLLRHCARQMRTDEESADVFLVYGAALMWSGGMYISRGGKVPVALSIYNFTDGMGLHRTPPLCGRHCIALCELPEASNPPDQVLCMGKNVRHTLCDEYKPRIL